MSVPRRHTGHWSWPVPTLRRKAPDVFRAGGVGPSPTYSYTAAVAEVEVDTETGMVEVSRICIAHDIGRSLNPVLVEGQVIGGVYMGVGEALMEEHSMRRLPPRLSEALVHRNPSMLDYKTLTMHDMPEVVVEIVEDPDPEGPLLAPRKSARGRCCPSCRP